MKLLRSFLLRAHFLRMDNKGDDFNLVLILILLGILAIGAFVYFVVL